MQAYLKIENPGICPTEGFTLLGASTKRSDQNAIGRFGSGNKHGVNVCLRHNLSPIVFCGSLKLEFGTRKQYVGNNEFQRVFVKYGGKDTYGTNRSSTEDLGYVLEYGAADWLSIDLALREFVSNSIDKAVEQGTIDFFYKWNKEKCYNVEEIQNNPTLMEEWRNALVEYNKTSRDWEKVVIEIVNENQVRAKADHTRVFVPLNQDVLTFYSNIGKWFLHFSEPELLHETILPKKNRNLNGREAAVIYRRGVRVREFESSEQPSLFDYNLESLSLDESRQVNDWQVQHQAAEAIIHAKKPVVSKLLQTFVNCEVFWEHEFQHYAFDRYSSEPEVASVWTSAIKSIVGENAVVTLDGVGEAVERKGYKRLVVPSAYNQAFRKMGVKTPDEVLTEDDIHGRSIVDATPDAKFAVDFVWNKLVEINCVNGNEKPEVYGFTHIMNAGVSCGGFYRDGKIYINTDLGHNASESAGIRGINSKLIKVVLEELCHAITKAADETRDFQDFAFLVASKLMTP